MAKSNKDARPLARLPKGLRDIEAAEIRGLDALVSAIRGVYDRYGFEPLETPAFEYTEALGKFLPDQDRPNEGVFSFADEDEQWLSLRYDLTAPLARYVAENFARLPKPFRRYAVGPVWRNEKPGPGRFRQFVQFDADTVGSESVAADAEMCMLAADTLEALGIERGDYVIKVNSRKVLDGVMEAIGVTDERQRVVVLRAVDKLDRLGFGGVRALLGAGRKDESGDFTKGAGLTTEQIDIVLHQLEVAYDDKTAFGPIQQKLSDSRLRSNGLSELYEMRRIYSSAGYDGGQILINFGVVRGLEYYTGPVFEAELTFDVKNDDGQPIRFGSVGGGGRYDDLVARFTGERVPATGFSIGVSRLQAALAALGRTKAATGAGPVVVLVLDRDRLADYQRIVQRLRNPDDGKKPIRAEMYLGSAGMKAQMKYADKRGSPCVVIQGSNERERGEIEIKDLIAGAEAAAAIKDNKAWKEARPAQVSVPEGRLVEAVREVLARHER